MTLFLAPPVTTCLTCHSSLHVHNTPVTVICYTEEGPLPALKITLRCSDCAINYRYEQYGGSTLGGFRYYNEPRPFVAASNVCYVGRNVCEQFVASG